ASEARASKASPCASEARASKASPCASEDRAQRMKVQETDSPELLSGAEESAQSVIALSCEACGDEFIPTADNQTMCFSCTVHFGCACADES
ncbi:MAG: hypothetical protein MK135_01875, partial [Polyangiaceae bacterium]|nr:hypothetical protein [Polyangiaceae bacterium]